MAQNKSETAFTVETMLGTPEAKPLPKQPAPKKTGRLKKTLLLAGIGAIGAATVGWGVKEYMEPDAPAITQTASAKIPVFNPLTLQQQVTSIADNLKAHNAAHPNTPYSPEQIEQAQRSFINNIEHNEMLKTANTPLSNALDTYLLKTLKTNLENQDLTLDQVVGKTGIQTVEMISKARQNNRTHSNHLLVPGLEKYINLKNAKQDHTGAKISETEMLISAVKSRIVAASALLNGHTNAQAIQLLETFRAVALSPDLKHAIEKSDYERKAASERATENVSKKMHANIDKGQDPFSALCAASQSVTGTDMNSRATPPAYIVKAHGAANAELTGKTTWVAEIRAQEKPTPSLPWQWNVVGLVAAGTVVGGAAYCWATRDKGKGLAGEFEKARKNDKKTAAQNNGEIDRAKNNNIPPIFRNKPPER